MINVGELILQASEARKMSYSPYSGFAVGAALLCANGEIYQGCNIESAAYSPTNCAERTAIFKAISEGDRKFIAIAIVGGKKEKMLGELEICVPCGVCRQVMAEFCEADKFIIILAKDTEKYNIYKLQELLPLSFGADNLK
ncbi:MAG: cytidine deaminase [Oscillospiraceae bacterium]